MKRLNTVLAVALMMHLAGAALAQSDGIVEGVLVGVQEREVGGQAYAALLVKPFTQDHPVRILVPPEPKDLAQVARRLRPGHQVEVEFVLEGKHRWLRGLDAQWRGQDQDPRAIERIRVRTGRRGDADPPDQEHERVRVEERKYVITDDGPPRERPRDSMRGLAGQLEQLAQQFRRLADQVARMERDMQALRAENERLRRLLGEPKTRDTDVRRPDRLRPERGRAPETSRRRPERSAEQLLRERALRDRPALPRLPDSLAGFKGILKGKLVRKIDGGLVLQLEQVTQVCEQNEADNPQAAVGQALVIRIKPAQESTEQFLRTLRSLKIGQDVLVEACHRGGEYLSVVEQLKALD